MEKELIELLRYILEIKKIGPHMEQLIKAKITKYETESKSSKVNNIYPSGSDATTNRE
jgi:hypothetical protein